MPELVSPACDYKVAWRDYFLYLCIVRYKMTLSYDGAEFCGWQIQKDEPSVQEAIEQSLSTLLREEIAVVGAGRTDTEVNASKYVAHFDCDKELDCPQLCYKLNAILPDSIAVSGLEAVSDDFHARFSASRREYRYYIHTGKAPFLEKYSYRWPYPGLDIDAMNRAAEHLLGTHDFSCFEKSGGDNKTSICTIYEAGWHKYCPEPAADGECWYFQIAADRFLRNMVRAIVGTLLEIGRGRRKEDTMQELLDSHDRCKAGQSVPGNALFLSGVEYPE